jgi:hypothetical protein
MKRALSVIGIVALVFGLHWIGQGTNLFPWPQNPVMDGHPAWIYIGVAASLAGLVAIGASLRRRRG